MTALFVDTSFWLALARPGDEFHHRALAWNQYVLFHRVDLVTTEAVLWELLNGLARPRSRGYATAVYRSVRHDPQFTVIDHSFDFNQSAFNRYVSRIDKEWSLTDCASFVEMERLAMTDALTSDHHFIQAGFNALLRCDPPRSG